MEIRKGTLQDIDEVAALYDALNDYLESHTNYPGWKKDIYPIREDAEQGIREENLWVAIEDGRIAGTVILNHQPEEAYQTVDWHNSFLYQDIFVVHTLAIHPQFMKRGIGRALLEFAEAYARQQNIKEIRLDVYEKNVPAIRLYESMGFRYVDTVDLGYGMHGLNAFRLYQRQL